MKTVFCGGLLGLMSLFLVTQSVLAGGIYLYEVGSADVGLAAAGYAARAQDAATAFTNPAGMTRIKQPSMVAGAMPMFLNIDFTPDGNTSPAAATLPGGSPANSGDTNGVLPSGGLFYVHPVNDKLALGVSMTGYFGLALDYQDDWVGRYYAQEAVLQAGAIQPTIAYKLNDQFSVGAGVAVVYGMMDTKLAVNNRELLPPTPNAPDGQIQLKDEDVAVQANLGLLYEPTAQTRFGLTYLSEAKLNFTTPASQTGVTRPLLSAALSTLGNLDLGVTMPQSVMFSAYHDLNDKLALMGNLGWQNWSQFGRVEVDIDNVAGGVGTSADLNYRDTWHAAVGTQYQVAEQWLLTAGIAFDSSMLAKGAATPAMPVGKSWRYAAGCGYDWSEAVRLNAAYELAWGGDLDMDVERGPLAGRVSGTYESVAVHFVSLNADWRF